MNTNMLSLAGRLSNHELLAQVKLLAQQEREATAALIVHLAVLDERGLYLSEGCSSMFTYCVQVLNLSEHAAYGRIEAARAARKYPVVLEMLSDGSVNLTAVGLVAAHLTSENHRELLDAVRHKSKRQVEELVASLRPRPLVPSTIRRLPTAGIFPAPTELTDAAASATAAACGGKAQSTCDHPRLVFGDIELGGSQSCDLPPSTPAQPSVSRPPLARRTIVAPLGPQHYRVQFTATVETCEKLRLAQDLLRHQIPNGDLGEIMDRALTALLKELAKQKCAATERPREGSCERTEGHPAASRSRHIPAEVKRTV